jgi:hypothetical protein
MGWAAGLTRALSKEKTPMFYVSHKPRLTPVFLIAVAVICLEFVREYSIVGAFNPTVWGLAFIAFGFWLILRALRGGTMTLRWNSDRKRPIRRSCAR